MKEVTALMRGGNVGKQVTKIARRYMKKFNDRRGLVANAQGKIECLKKVVPSIQAADRTIIFSQTKDAAEKAVNTLYNYILLIYNKLQYGNIIEDIFTESRKKVDNTLTDICPESIQKFVSVYENIDSNNPEDWANAIHSCRRILIDFANSIYPPSKTPITVGGKIIKIDNDQYINRLIQYIKSKSQSKTYNAIVGCDLKSIGERLDAVNDAVCKGTHTYLTKNEASKYLIHTYILLSDIIEL